MSQTSKIPFHLMHPLSGSLKVLLEPPEKLSDLIEVVDTQYEREKFTQQWGIILEIGPDTFSPRDRVRVGDMAVFDKYSGSKLDDPNNPGISYRTMKVEECFSFISKEDLDANGYDRSYVKKGAHVRQLVAALDHVKTLKDTQIENHDTIAEHYNKAAKEKAAYPY